MEEERTKKLQWDLDRTDPEQGKRLRAALRKVNDPELGLNLIDLGMIRNAEMKDGKLNISMILTTPFCPFADAMKADVKKEAEAIFDAETIVEILTEPWDPTMMEDQVDSDLNLS